MTILMAPLKRKDAGLSSFLQHMSSGGFSRYSAPNDVELRHFAAHDSRRLEMTERSKWENLRYAPRFHEGVKAHHLDVMV